MRSSFINPMDRLVDACPTSNWALSSAQRSKVRNTRPYCASLEHWWTSLLTPTGRNGERRPASDVIDVAIEVAAKR
jgi:hypothetical protein